MLLNKKMMTLIVASGLSLASGSVFAGGLEGVPVVGELLTNTVGQLGLGNLPIAGDLLGELPIASDLLDIEGLPVVGQLLPIASDLLSVVPIPSELPLEGLPVAGLL